jgi:hypothetical protein
MNKYWVRLSANATVGTMCCILSTSEEEAKSMAIELAKSGDVTWNYDGVDDGTIEIDEVSKG